MIDFERRARSFVRSRFPRARAAFLGGSAASGGATKTSDLDVLIVLSHEHGDVSFVETSRYDGQLVEAFVYGPEALERWLDQGRSDCRPVLDRLIGFGIPIAPGDVSDALAANSSRALASGPDPTLLQIDQRRYSLSAWLDDLDWAGFRQLPGAESDVMTHGDLIPGNLLVERDRIVGVLDSGGFGPADPALDLVAAWHMLDGE